MKAHVILACPDWVDEADLAAAIWLWLRDQLYAGISVYYAKPDGRRQHVLSVEGEVAMVEEEPA